MTWLDLLIKGGPVMALIGACSLAALALLADRTIFLLATRENPNDLDRELRECGGGAEQLGRALDGRRGAVAALWRGGLSALPDGPAAIDRAMHAEGLRQMARAERGLSLLGAIITLTPMLGFLGTIPALIRAFMEWERLGAISSGMRWRAHV
jgi:biopolymer transport protein ExbB